MGSFLAAPNGEDPNSLLQMKAELERWKKQDASLRESAD